MKNLAGDMDCDRHIVEELRRATIQSIPYNGKLGEVPSRLHGVLGPFTFWRAWYYWVVHGPMPLYIAQEIDQHPVGRPDVRVNGYSGGLVPNAKAARWYMPGGCPVTPTKDQIMYERLREQNPQLPNFVWHDDPASIGATPYITSYNIDSEVGLMLFVNTVRKHEIDKVARPSWWKED